MKSLIEGLPPEVAQRIHPDWRKNEADYWAKRDELLVQYRDQWIGYANGRVIVTGTSPVEVFHKAQESGQHPFVTCVGREHEPNRMRRAAFASDTTYAGEPLPMVTMEFRKQVGAPGLVLQEVIPDTGADSGAHSWQSAMPPGAPRSMKIARWGPAPGAGRHARHTDGGQEAGPNTSREHPNVRTFELSNALLSGQVSPRLIRVVGENG